MRKLNEEKGAFAPFVGILIVLLVLLVGLVVDLGHLHNVKIELQRAVDAAALAGAGQLLGDEGEEGRAIAVAEETATANFVDATNIDLTTDNIDVDVGFWDTEALGEPAVDRYAEDGTPFNAVRVNAEREVDHFFFFPLPSSTVGANAIAVQEREQLTIPLALISCIPSTGPQQGEINLCGIYAYTFESQVENSAGWTSLTIGGEGGSSQQEVAALFSDPDGLALFNEIAGLLLETDVVDQPTTFDETFLGCEDNVDTNILCGLGGGFKGYDTPTGIPEETLTRYNDGLPNFITASDDEMKAWEDLITLDGALLEGEEQLKTWKEEGTEPYASFITTVKIKGQETYVPDFNRVSNYAGYPPVNATTGTMSSIMRALLERVAETEGKKVYNFKSKFTDFNFPFTPANNADPDPDFGDPYADGETVLFTIPVIFAGSCEKFDPNSHKDSISQKQEEEELHFIGLANILMTRVFKGGDCYQARTPVITDLNNPETTCNREFDPEMVLKDEDLGFFCDGITYPPQALEGLVRPPGLGEERGSVARLYLVK